MAERMLTRKEYVNIIRYPEISRDPSSHQLWNRDFRGSFSSRITQLCQDRLGVATPTRKGAAQQPRCTRGHRTSARRWVGGGRGSPANPGPQGPSLAPDSASFVASRWTAPMWRNWSKAGKDQGWEPSGSPRIEGFFHIFLSFYIWWQNCHALSCRWHRAHVRSKTPEAALPSPTRAFQGALGGRFFASTMFSINYHKSSNIMNHLCKPS